LYVIRSPKGKGKSRKEWEARKYGTSWKAKIEAIIDDTIPKAQDYAHFIELLNEAGVEVKEGKHIAFRLQEQQRFVRGKTLGENYTRENIAEAIKNKDKIKQPTIEKFDKKIEFIARKQQIAATKELANILVLIRRENIRGVSDFDIKIDELKEQSRKVKADIKILDSKNSQYKEVAKYLVAYNKYLPIMQQYQKRSFITKKNFYKKYESELLAFEHALKQLEKLGINTNVDPDKVVELVRQQTQKTTELHTRFKQTEGRIDELRNAKKLVENILQPTEISKKLEIKRDREI
jgi:Relaxase/Mobilisation nuclease domain.